MAQHDKYGRLGVMSDTHGSLQAWRQALAVFGRVDAVLHAGDVLGCGYRSREGGRPLDLADEINSFELPVYIARGNCDTDYTVTQLHPALSPCVSLLWHGKKILMMHGDYFSLLRRRALEGGADLAITGHTHVASCVREEGTIFLNPGSTTFPQGRDPESAAVVDTEGVSILTLSGKLLHREPW